MGFIGGDLRESFIGRVKGADPGSLLAVPIDVGKNSAAALVCDFWGEIVAPPFVFDLNERGFHDFAVVIARAEAERDATWSGLASSKRVITTVRCRLVSKPTGSRSPYSIPRRSKRTATRIS
jgi:hypothetical protein